MHTMIFQRLKKHLIISIAVAATPLFALPADAQESQCAVLVTINQIEAQFATPQNQSLPAGGKLETASSFMNILRGQNTNLLIADQIFGAENWITSYLSSRNSLIQFKDNSAAFNQAQTSSQFQTLSHQLAVLNQIIPCEPGEAESNGPESSISDGHINSSDDAANYADAPIGALSQLTQFVSKLSNDIAFNISTISPYLIFIALFGLLWLYMKYEDHKRNLRQRFRCHCEVLVHGRRFAQKGYITDISRLGVGLHMTTHVPEKKWLVVSTGAWEAKVFVTRSSENIVGARFAKPLKTIPDFILIKERKKWVSKANYTAKPAPGPERRAD